MSHAPSRRTALAAGFLALAVATTGCLRIGPQGPDILAVRIDNPPLEGPPKALLKAKMAAQRSAVPRYTADVRLSAKGPEGRMRILAQLLLERPDKARITLLLPFGPAAWVGVSNAERLAAWDVPHAKIRRAPATREGLAELSAIGDIGMEPEALVALGFGEVAVPDDARLTRINAQEPNAHDTYLWQWASGAERRALVVAMDGTLQRYDLQNLHNDHISVTLKPPGALGVPAGFRLRYDPAQSPASTKDASDNVVVVEGVFTDVRPIPPPTPNAFVLEDRPPPGE